jgi:hypothetical protein
MKTKTNRNKNFKIKQRKGQKHEIEWDHVLCFSCLDSEKLEDTKVVIINHRTNKNYYQKKNKDKKKNNNIQNVMQKTKDRAMWTPLTTGGELKWSGTVSSSSSGTPLIL